MNGGRLRVSLVAATLLALTPVPAGATPFTTVNPGFTISYTFGRGLTYGFEVSVVKWPGTLAALERQPFGTGVAVDLSTDFSQLFKVRLGGEIVGPFIGVETGPALVVDPSGAHLALGTTFWGGWYVMPYYTHTLIFGDEPNLHELGTYLKVYLDPDGTGAAHSHHHDWD